MKRFFYTMIFLVSIGGMLTACNNEDTYAERIKQQRAQISNFLKKGALAKSTEGDTLLFAPGGINAISESQFAAQGYTTDVSKNEYVLFSNTGIYMQILRKGVGEPLEKNTTASLLVRFTEYNIAGDSISMTNMSSTYSMVPDVMTCTNTYGTISGYLVSGVLYTLVKSSSTSVPTGWLKPLEYINIGRATTADEQIAKVRLIVPSTSGHGFAQKNYTACFYEMTYQRARS